MNLYEKYKYTDVRINMEDKKLVKIFNLTFENERDFFILFNCGN